MRQVKNGVPHQDLIVEVYDIKPDNKIGAQQLLNQIVDAFLRIDPVLIQIRAVSDSKRHAHVAFLVPSADVVGSALRFEIEVNNVQFLLLPIEISR